MDDWTTGFGFGVFWLMPFLITLFAFQLMDWSWLPIPGFVVFVLLFVVIQFLARVLLKKWVVNIVSEEN